MVSEKKCNAGMIILKRLPSGADGILPKRARSRRGFVNLIASCSSAARYNETTGECRRLE
jgi:hypothetical protein